MVQLPVFKNIMINIYRGRRSSSFNSTQSVVIRVFNLSLLFLRPLSLVNVVQHVEGKKLCLLPIGDSFVQAGGQHWMQFKASLGGVWGGTTLPAESCVGMTSWRYELWRKLAEHFLSPPLTNGNGANGTGGTSTTTRTLRVEIDFLGSLSNHYGDALGSSPRDYSYGARCQPEVYENMTLYSSADADPSSSVRNNVSLRFPFKHEGHTGWRAKDLIDGFAMYNPDWFMRSDVIGFQRTAGRGRLADWVRTYAVEGCDSICAIVQAGVNDLVGVGGRTVEQVVGDLSRIVDIVSAGFPEANSNRTTRLRFLVAEPPPSCDAAKMGTLATSVRQSFSFRSGTVFGGLVDSVDLASGFNVTAMTFDGCHPNVVGAEFLGEKFFQKVLEHCDPLTEPPVYVVPSGGGSTTTGGTSGGSSTSTGTTTTAPSTSVGASSSASGLMSSPAGGGAAVGASTAGGARASSVRKNTTRTSTSTTFLYRKIPEPASENWDWATVSICVGTVFGALTLWVLSMRQCGFLRGRDDSVRVTPAGVREGLQLQLQGGEEEGGEQQQEVEGLHQKVVILSEREPPSEGG